MEPVKDATKLWRWEVKGSSQAGLPVQGRDAACCREEKPKGTRAVLRQRGATGPPGPLGRSTWASGLSHVTLRVRPPAAGRREETGRCHGGWGTPRAESRREDTAPPQRPFGAMQAGRTCEWQQDTQMSPDLSGAPGPIGGPSSCTREEERSGELPSQRSRTGCELQWSATPPTSGRFSSCRVRAPQGLADRSLRPFICHGEREHNIKPGWHFSEQKQECFLEGCPMIPHKTSPLP